MITGTDSRISAIAGTLAYASTIAGAACQAKSMDLLNLVDEPALDAGLKSEKYRRR